MHLGFVFNVEQFIVMSQNGLTRVSQWFGRHVCKVNNLWGKMPFELKPSMKMSMLKRVSDRCVKHITILLCNLARKEGPS